jgi:hypothetical protein
MMLRCHACGRNVPDRQTTVAGRNDLGDDIHLCHDCDVPPHTRAEAAAVKASGVVVRWGH